jgi:hypothetical protein
LLSGFVKGAVSSIDAPSVTTTLKFRGGGKKDKKDKKDKKEGSDSDSGSDIESDADLQDRFKSSVFYQKIKEEAADEKLEIVLEDNPDGTGMVLRFVKRDAGDEENRSNSVAFFKKIKEKAKVEGLEIVLVEKADRTGLELSFRGHHPPADPPRRGGRG